MASSKKILYSVKNITKTFVSDRGKIDGLSNISFDVKEGEKAVDIQRSGKNFIVFGSYFFYNFIRRRS